VRKIAAGDGLDELRTLIDRCLDDDEQAWEALIARYDRLINGVIRSFRLEETDGADVYQRVALALQRHLGDMRDPRRLPTWLVTTTRRECRREIELDEQRDATTRDGDDPHDPGRLEEELGRITDLARVIAAIDDLDPPCPELLRSIYLDGRCPPSSEIAARLGIAVDSFGPTRARCLELLRQRLRQSAVLRKPRHRERR
jgi:RNA polymerase sigma factor (sigma-70 family)